MRTHATAPRRNRPPHSPLLEGRFGRMFRKLPAAPALDDADLVALAQSMREPDANAGGGWSGAGQPPLPLENPEIPAAYTYFGQFVDHDITFDPVSSLQGQNDPDALTDFRSPRFDLDSVYGSGPEDQPYLYSKSEHGRLLLGTSNDQPDLLRNTEGVAMIGDPRNDENIIVSQLQLALITVHNKLLDQITADANVPADRRFEEAQRLTRWHYQWVVVNDFLKRTAGADVVARLFTPDDPSRHFHLRHYTPQKNPYMPVEFSVAAYRYGHSQVRPAYSLNDTVRDIPIFVAGDEVGELADLRGGRPLPGQWKIDWKQFLPVDGASPQPSRLLDSRLSAGLFDLPHLGADQPQSLAERNLRRGQSFGLPSGQDLARHLRVAPLDSAALGAPEPTPLWFYILKESELSAGGTHLGPVGATIVAEVLLGLLRADPSAWINQDPEWKPTLPAASGDAASFQLADLVKFAST